jgi:hypothetical protein
MFIPESYIIEKGYDQGVNFVTATSNEPYAGFYHKDKDNNYWTGENHTLSSILLTRVTSDTPMNGDYLLKNNVTSRGFTQQFRSLLDTPLIVGEYVPPTEANYALKYFTRYFAQLKASVSPYVVEISRSSYDGIVNNRIFLISYNVAEVIWKLVGPLNDIYDNNVRIESGVRDTNLRSIQNAERLIPGLSNYLNNPLEYAVRLRKRLNETRVFECFFQQFGLTVRLWQPEIETGANCMFLSLEQ